MSLPLRRGSGAGRGGASWGRFAHCLTKPMCPNARNSGRGTDFEIPGISKTRAAESRGATAPLQAGGAGGPGPPAEAGSPLAEGRRVEEALRTARSSWGVVGARAEPDREPAAAPARSLTAQQAAGGAPGPRQQRGQQHGLQRGSRLHGRLGCDPAPRSATAVERTDP